MFNNFLLCGSSRMPNFKCDIFNFPASTGNFNTTANRSFASVLDGDPVVLTYDDFTINSGHTVTVSQRCKGLYLLIQGDLTVNGTLSMTARGAKGAGKYVITDWRNPVKRVLFTDDSKVTGLYDKNQIIYPVGGLGSTSAANPGVNGACGSGGYSTNSSLARRGGSGTSFSGGAGAGGGAGGSSGAVYDTHHTSAGADNGGQGGSGSTAYHDSSEARHYGYGGSGAGNPAGSGNQYCVGTAGTGGLMILIVLGNIVINGSIQSHGSRGGWAHAFKSSGALEDSTSNGVWAVGGSGSGGGAIHIFYKGTLTNPGKITVTGGAGGGKNDTANASVIYSGRSGAAGSINLVKMAA